MRWLTKRIHFGWVAATAIAMTVAYVATAPTNVVTSPVATDVDVAPMPVVTQPPRPVIANNPAATPNSGAPNVPIPDFDDVERDVEGAREEAEQEREQAEEEAEEQRKAAEEEAEEARAEAEEAEEEARAEAERRRAEAERFDDD